MWGHYLTLSKTGKVYEWRGESCSPWLQALSRTPVLQSIEEVVVAIACGCHHSVALTENGDVYQWGYVLCHSGWVKQSISSKVNIPGETVAKVVCNRWQSLVLTKTGKIFTWGWNKYGLGDLSGCTKSDTPVQVGKDIISSFVDIDANNWWTCAAVTEAGEVYMWGMGENDESVGKPKLTEFKELHQVFAKYRFSHFSWLCASDDKITSDSCAFIGDKPNKEIFETLVKNHEKLQKDLSNLEKTHEKMENEHEKLKKDHAKRFEKLEEEFDKLRALLVHSEESRLKHEDLVTAQVSLRRLELEYNKQQEKLEKIEKDYQQEQLEKMRIIVEHKNQLAELYKNQLGELDRLRAVEVDNAKLQGEIERLRVIEVDYKTQLEKLENLKAIEVDNVKKQQEIEKLRDIVVQYTKQLEELENPRTNEVEYVKQQEKLQKL